MADIWLRRKGTRADSWYVTIGKRRVRLRTKDATVARTRAKLARAGRWPPLVEAAADASADAMTDPFMGGGGAEEPPSAAPPSTAPPPPTSAPPPPPADWAAAASDAAQAQAAAQEPPPPPPPQVSNAELAKICVVAQLKLSEAYVRWRVWRPFRAPEPEPGGIEQLAKPYETLLDYAGAAIQLPPWVNGILVPVATILTASTAIVAGFSDEARRQKREAEADAPMAQAA